MAIDDAHQLYVGGQFTATQTGVTAHRIDRFDPAANGGSGAWSALSGTGGEGLDDQVKSIAVVGQSIYAGGTSSIPAAEAWR
jgi:hypothetical protein